MTLKDYIADGQASDDDAAAASAYNADFSRARTLWVTPETLISRLAADHGADGIAAARRIVGGLKAAAAADPLVEIADHRLRNSEKGLNLGDASTLGVVQQLVEGGALQPSDAAMLTALVLGPPVTAEDVDAARSQLADEEARADRRTIADTWLADARTVAQAHVDGRLTGLPALPKVTD
ncbi:MAG: hypothetical protein AAGD32_05275 [Planctomycetota bacterium]